ncbi:Uncharacterised protein [Acinetobacter baumannii]|nr:Uncharacterised protein [Acinetobacter baumannii]
MGDLNVLKDDLVNSTLLIHHRANEYIGVEVSDKNLQLKLNLIGTDSQLQSFGVCYLLEVVNVLADDAVKS